jgi:cation:H+ antiporter
LDIAALLVAFIVILVGAELFTNAVEWFGHKLNLAEGAVGSVLAAIGTALPETMIPIVAIVFHSASESHAIGVGTILGAPFMLSTLAMFVTGVGVLAYRKRRPSGSALSVDVRVLEHDMGYFALAYGVAIAAALLPVNPSWPRWIVAGVLVAIYARHVKGHFDADTGSVSDGLAPLRLHRLDRAAHAAAPSLPRLRVVTFQVAAALALIVFGAAAFVDSASRVASLLGISGLLFALVVAPIATELPEKLNSLIWVRQGKDTLALGNITGAMVFQAAIPTVIALLFVGDAWTVGPGSATAFGSAAIAMLSSAAIFIPMSRRGGLSASHLLIGGAFYLAYIVVAVGAIASSR